MAPSVRPRVLVTRQLPGEALGRLGERVERVQGLDGLITLLTDRVDEPLLANVDWLGRAELAAMNNLLAALEGKRPPHCVNPELFP